MTLRSAQWLAGLDETALAHRAALRAAGAPLDRRRDKPIIGIANSASELNPCNLVLREQADAVKRGILDAGGVPVEFPTMSLGEDLMKPSAMLYRNLMAMEIEENLRSYPLDGVVLLANCDKTVPACLMGAASANLPAIMVIGGARPVVSFREKPIGAGTDLWHYLNEYRAGRLSDADWDEFEQCYSCGLGACNVMGTAVTMAIVSEALGMTLPGASTVPADDPDRLVLAEDAGRRAVQIVHEGLSPSDILTPAAFRNAIRALNAIGGSTNALIHVSALAGRVGVDLPLESYAELGHGIGVLADIQPNGRFLAQDFHAAGGVPALLAAIRDAIERDVVTVSGKPLVSRQAESRSAIRSVGDPVFAGPAYAIVRGNLAPDGAVLKASAASPELMRHRGPALVFSDYHDMRRRLDDPDLDVSPDTVLVLAGCGPVGVPGMPEWGMVPIPRKLVEAGVTDMVRITDARMSGTSFGTVFLHVAPEAAIGGPLALVRTGDTIDVDVPAGRLDVVVSPEEWERRRSAWRAPVSEHLRGWPALYQRHVTQAPQGCDLDFLTAPTPAHRRVVPPIVGRS